MDEFKDWITSKKPLDEGFLLELFRYQASRCLIYKEFLSYLSVRPSVIRSTNQIPFLPIDFFKYFRISSRTGKPQVTFLSSGTTQSERSKHHVYDLEYYRFVSRQIFESKYGTLNQFNLYTLLPSYRENPSSSLIYMVDSFIRTAKAGSGYISVRELNRDKKEEINSGDGILLGVSFALLELAESGLINLSDTIIMETGGMKGRRRELSRIELHQKLMRSFNISRVHSEYGMTELLSQAYSDGDGIFEEPFSMKIFIRDLNDPFGYEPIGKVGAINIIDTANVESCCFIATQDIGRKMSESKFEVLGRIDHSDLRGCNLLYTQ